MEKLRLLILQYNRHKAYFGLLLFTLISFRCTSSKKISNDDWKIDYGHFQGMDFLNCKKKSIGKFLYEYTFEASKSNIEQRTVLLKSFASNGYMFHWYGVNDTLNITLPKVLRPIRIQAYDHDEKIALGKILLQTNLVVLNERRNYFDSIQYFILIDSIKLQLKR